MPMTSAREIGQLLIGSFPGTTLPQEWRSLAREFDPDLPEGWRQRGVENGRRGRHGGFLGVADDFYSEAAAGLRKWLIAAVISGTSSGNTPSSG